MNSRTIKTRIVNKRGYFSCDIDASIALLEVIGIKNLSKNRLGYKDRVELIVRKL